jgi:hypothetical protein
MKNKFATLMVISFWLLSLAQCGSEDSNSSKLKAKLVPQDPVVINADKVLFGGTDQEISIAKPWFLFKFGLNNKSENTLILQTITFKTGMNQPDFEFSLDPSAFCDADANGIERSELAQIPPNTFYTGIDTLGGPLGFCDATDITTTTPYEDDHWYVYGLPELRNGDFNYSIDVTFQGWFEDSTGEAIERLELEDAIDTQ